MRSVCPAASGYPTQPPCLRSSRHAAACKQPSLLTNSRAEPLEHASQALSKPSYVPLPGVTCPVTPPWDGECPSRPSEVWPYRPDALHFPVPMVVSRMGGWRKGQPLLAATQKQTFAGQLSQATQSIFQQCPARARGLQKPCRDCMQITSANRG